MIYIDLFLLRRKDETEKFPLYLNKLSQNPGILTIRRISLSSSSLVRLIALFELKQKSGMAS